MATLKTAQGRCVYTRGSLLCRPTSAAQQVIRIHCPVADMQMLASLPVPADVRHAHASTATNIYIIHTCLVLRGRNRLSGCMHARAFTHGLLVSEMGAKRSQPSCSMRFSRSSSLGTTNSRTNTQMRFFDMLLLAFCFGKHLD